MGNLIKAPKQGQSGNDILPGGLHLAIISAMSYAKNEQGEYLVKADTGEMALDILFQNGKGKKIRNIFWMTEKSQWVFDALCRAVEVDNKKETPSVHELIGKRLWICIGIQYVVKNGILERDTHGKLITYSKLIPLFFRVHDPLLPPAVDGDPNLNDGVPSKRFLINKPEEMPYDYAEQVKKDLQLN